LASATTRRGAGWGSNSGVRSRGGSAALNAYFDTSALVKLIVSEDGSDLADELWDAADLKVSSHLVYPEARAALAAALRAGRINARGVRRAVADLDAAVASVQRIGVDEALARDAGRLAEEHALRGYDAVHLATALSVEDPTLVIVSWDGELARAALRCGRSVAPALVD
jgi:predicted nucleic acid-binding protein